MTILQLFLTGFKIGTLSLQGQAPYHWANTSSVIQNDE
jgi:hypothetical protein